MKINVNSLTRYHTFNLATALKNDDKLNKLVTGYPRNKLGTWNSLGNNVNTSYCSAILWKLMTNTRYKEFYRKSASEYFDMYSSKQIEHSLDAVIGLSSFMLNNINRAKKFGCKTIVDHGSLHLEDEKNAIEKECCIYGFNDLGGDYQRSWLVEKISDEFESCDNIFVCSDLAKRSLINNNVAEEKIFKNALGVDLSVFNFQERRDFYRGNGKLKVLCVGSLIPRKGLHRLIHTLSERKFRNVELTLIGSSINRGYFEYLTKIKNVSITYVKPVPENQLVNFYNDADLFILPSISDGWGMVTQQAIACGTMVLISNQAGSSELIQDNVNGFSFDPYSEWELANKLEYIVENYSDLHQRIIMNSINKIKEEFSWRGYSNRVSEWANEKL